MKDLDIRFNNIPKRDRRKFIMCKYCGSCKSINNFRVIELDEEDIIKYNDFCMKCDTKLILETLKIGLYK